MKTGARFACSWGPLLAGLLLWTAAAPAASQNKPASATNRIAAVAAPEIPKSVFTLPNKPEEGKDPFFPKSMRPYAHAPTTTNAPVQAVSLVLNGITGPPRRTAMINGRTLEAGEDAEVKDHNGSKTRIKCLEIKDDSAIIEIISTGERKELRLRSF